MNRHKPLPRAGQTGTGGGLPCDDYTGYSYESLIDKKQPQQLLEHTDLLVDGRFEVAQKVCGLNSGIPTNQRLKRYEQVRRENRLVLSEIGWR